MTYKMERQYNSPNFTPAAQVQAVFGVPRVVKGTTEHWWGAPETGLTYEGVISWLCRQGGNTSAHNVVDGSTRRVACIVDYENAAWHAGNAIGNATTIGNENNPNTAAHASTMDVTAELLADLRDPAAYGDQPVYPHSYWTNTQCPGTFDVNEIDRLSYTKQPGTEWGDVHDKKTTTPPVVNPPIVTPPVNNPPVQAEWVRNVQDITDTKLSVLPAAGTVVIDLNTIQPVPNSTIPKGTQVDIAKKTTVGGKVFYISSYSATKGMARGILASDLGIPATPPPQEKPEWLKNIVDITDKDMWTRSAAPVLNLADGATVNILPINTKVRVIKTTTILGEQFLVLDGEKTCLQTVYLSDTPISSPDSDLDKENNTLLKQILSVVQTILSKLTSVFK